ncbi:MAG TPA: response regulator [Desulfobulbaceae bacterium]|nr:response regulator [Desulfobulbaceae bacterium]
MTDKILFVDDEANVIQSMKRQLRKRFPMQTALSGDEALRKMKEEGPFAVIVSDMRMPGMNGIELLKKVKNLYPDTVRIMLTGNADQETAIEAVNSGEIFRFLTKPCSTAVLVPALALAQRHYRLINAEKELLQQTLMGSITVLSELLSQANPTVFSAGRRIKRYATHAAQKMDLPNIWQIEVAAMLAQIGCISLPSDVINKRYAGLPLDEEEERMWTDYPEIGARLLDNIPRLESVTKIIRLQQKNFDTFDEELKTREFEEVLVGAQILKAVIDLDLLLHQGYGLRKAIVRLQAGQGTYNPEVLAVLGDIPFQDNIRHVSLAIDDITVGMIAGEDITAKNGALILPKGQKITWSSLQGLYNFSRKVGIVEPVKVYMMQEAEDQDDQ